MKKLSILLTLAAFVIGGALFNSCEKEQEIQQQEEFSQTIDQAKHLLIGNDFDDCETVCINLEGAPVIYFPKTDQETVQWGGPNDNRFTKTVTLTYYNTETHFVFEWKSTEALANLDLDGEGIDNDDIVGIGDGWRQYKIELDELFVDGWEACDEVEFEVKITGSGPPAEFDVKYALIGICVDCEDIFATAYAGDTEGENSGLPGAGFNNAWWYAFDVEGDEVQDIWAEVDDEFEVIGTATLTEDKIILNLGTWYLQEGEETVKYYVYEDGELPTEGRPIPGRAPYKGTNLGIPLIDDIRYYVIHLDVETCR